MAWLSAIINLVIPLLFLASLCVLVYCVVLLVISLVRKSRPMRSKAFKISILPLLYIVGMLSFFKINQEYYDHKMIPEIKGAYVYRSGDSINVSAFLNGDNTYTINNGTTSFTGKWSITPHTTIITFFDENNKEITHTPWEKRAGKGILPLYFGKTKVELVKD